MHGKPNYVPSIVVRYAHFTTIGSTPLAPMMPASYPNKILTY